MILIRLKPRSLNDQFMYSIVVSSNQVAPSSGKFLEKIGHYKPRVDRWSNKYVFVDFDRLKFWVERGAKLHPSIFVLMRTGVVYHKQQTVLHKNIN